MASNFVEGLVFFFKKRLRYKYNLHSNVEYKTSLSIDKPYDNGFVVFTTDGLLQVKVGYSWDGPSGPTFDTKNFMRGSLIHDALYQLIREGVLPQSSKFEADKILRKICLECGMSKFRAWYIYQGLRFFGKSYTKPDLLSAP